MKDNNAKDYKKGDALLAEVGSFKKSNVLISSKYKSTVMENKILAVSMSRIKIEEGRPIAKLTVSDFKHMVDGNNGSFYQKIKRAAKSMSGRQMFIEDKENNSFMLINLIGKVEYKDGTMTIKFEPDLKEYLVDLQKNYTTLNIEMMMSLESQYGFRLYELLKSRAYVPKGVHDTGLYKMVFGLSELKVTIGIVNTQTDAVSKALQTKNPDFDNIVNNIALEKSFKTWYDFKKRVLEPSIAEINEKTDLHVEFIPIGRGHGGKICEIEFYVTRKDIIEKNKNNKPLKTEEDIEVIVEDIKEPNPEELMQYVEELQELIEEPIKIKDYKAILKAANYNIDKVKRVYELACQQSEINNLVAWLISAIKNNYDYEPIPKTKGMTYEQTMAYQELLDDLKEERERMNSNI